MARNDNKPSNCDDSIKETLDFLLHAYRAKLAVDTPSESCPFDFSEFLQNWKGKYDTWEDLKEAIIKDLEPLANEGLFDSILPYLTASLNQSRANKEYSKKLGEGGASDTSSYRDVAGTIPLISAELTPSSNSTTEVASGSNEASTNGRRSSIGKDKGRRAENEEGIPGTSIEFDPEIVIHVCDEAKCLKKDFYCVQSTLVKEMGYFTKVTVKGQRLRDMDISVHCDISVFDWLMKWVKSRNGGYEQTPLLDPANVIGLMVSADFLQMENLVSECLQFSSANISHVINLSPNLGCLNESLTNKVLHFFNNFEVETRINHIDRSDRITSRFYTQLIMALNEAEPDESLGHYASTATLFRCNICGQLLINNVAFKVPCCTVKCDSRGRIYATHVRDPNWTLCQFIRDLKKELKMWKKVLWSLVHFFCCSHCQQYFSAKDYASCRYHPSPPTPSVVVVSLSNSKLSGSEQDDLASPSSGGIRSRMDSGQGSYYGTGSSSARRSGQSMKNIDSFENDSVSDTIVCPYGTYPCCKQPSYQFHPFPSSTGCEFKVHTLSHYAEDDPALKLITAFKDLIIVSPTLAERSSTLDWTNLIDLTPQKSPSTASTANVLSQRMTGSSMFGLHDVQTRRRMMLHTESSSTESNSFSDNEELFPKTDENIFLNPRYSGLSDCWSWNPEYTTRYNQDMQREREEKLMSDLEMLLAQRVAIDPGGSSGFRLGYLSRRLQKNNGGSFIKLEEKWREEIQQSGSKSVKLSSKLTKN